MAKTWDQYVRRYFPKASDEEVRDILWGHTAFPFVRKALVKRQIQQLPRALRIAKKAGRPLCDNCRGLAGDRYRYDCNECGDALRRARHQPTEGEEHGRA